jgi:hypothetical protein
MSEFMRIFTFLAPIATLMGIFMGIRNYSKLNPPDVLLIVYLIFVLVIDIIVRYMVLVLKFENNLFLIPVYALGEFLIIAVLYLIFLLRIKNHIVVIILSGVSALILFDLFYLSRLTDTANFQSIAKIIANLSIIVICIFYSWKGILNTGIRSLEFVGINPYIIGYFSINLIIFLSINFLINEALGIVTYFWILNLVVNVLFYIKITHFLWKRGRIR